MPISALSRIRCLRLIECGADMCAAVYPIKRIDWDKVKSIVEAGRPDPGAAAMKYVFEVDDPNAMVEKCGFIRVRYAGTGFLLIRRQTILRMCAQYPQLRFASATIPSTRRPQATTAMLCSNA